MMTYDEVKYHQEARQESIKAQAHDMFGFSVYSFFASNALIDEKKNYIPKIIQRYFNIFGETTTVENLYERILFKHRTNRRK